MSASMVWMITKSGAPSSTSMDACALIARMLALGCPRFWVCPSIAGFSARMRW